jgi:hypothetical protein
MYGKRVMTCFEYQVFLYGSDAITYLDVILWLVTEPALWPIPHFKRTVKSLYHTNLKSKGETVWLKNPHM